METKVIGLDVYGTILPSRGKQVKRKGLDEFLTKCINEKLILCTCSDAETKSVLRDFIEAGLKADYFDKFFKMERKSPKYRKEPKDFNPILVHYNLKPRELLIIGDREKRDIEPAKKLGCNTFHIPVYFKSNYNEFNMEEIKLK
jgi:FMN phosphatase YigB (HAD superfamily)